MFGRFITKDNGYLYILLYNFCAFALQMPMGVVLDALDAYKKRLVKRIEVKGFDIKNLRGTDRYLFLEGIVISPKKPPMARIEFEIGCNKSINRKTRVVGVDDDLFALSTNMEQYR